MANKHIRFFDKRGNPLNFNYIGPTGTSINETLDLSFDYISINSGISPSPGYFSLADIGSGIIYVNSLDRNGFSALQWASTILDSIIQGTVVRINVSVYPASNLSFRVNDISISGGIITLSVDRFLGSTIISNNNNLTLKAEYKDLYGGYFSGEMYFDEVSAGLYENQQLFIVQELIVGGNLELGYPHTNATGATGTPILWRTRWENDTYGDVDVSEIIFTYKITENDPSIGGDPSIVNYQNVAIPVTQDSGDFYSIAYPGYLQTNSVISTALSVNIALNAPDVAAEVYQRKLIIEDISSGSPEKIVEILFYGQIIGEDSRLDVLTSNLGRAFFESDSNILRNHDPSEPLPNWLEINEKRKELMVAGEEIFPYIGSYKGLIGALQFFGYQDLRIKEYWLNLAYQRIKDNPLLENQVFLNKYDTGFMVNQSIQIADLLDNENSGKYRLTQTYGPDEEGNYVLNVSGEDTLIPSKTYKKTSLFGLYYDINRSTALEDEYGYPIVEDAFLFSQEEVLTKLFALKQRLKQTYLPLNARIVDITGEGVYFQVYNTRSWTDTMNRNDIDSGFYIDVQSFPIGGFLEDLRAFSLRTSPVSIQAPMNYNNEANFSVSVSGPSGDAFSFAGIRGFNPTITLERGKTYNFSLQTSGFNFFLTTDPSLNQVDPLGVYGNGSSSGTVTINVNPQEQNSIYYYSTVNSSKLSGTINIINSPVSDLGNINSPTSNLQNYSPAQNRSMQTAISNFYELKSAGKIKLLGDGTYDPVEFIDPLTQSTYKNPIGMPVIIESIVDRWIWDEMGVNWNGLILPTFSPGDLVDVKVFQDINGITGGVGAQIVGPFGNYNDQIYEVILSSNFSTAFISANNLTSPIQENQLMTWGNIDFSTYVEIEWIIEKPTSQPGTPYYFKKRGLIIDYYKLAHFLPYTGEYTITCNVYDSFNYKSNVIKKSLIVVSPIQIDVDAWTRYRQNEVYNWNQTVRDWNSYESIWEYPAEGKTYSELIKEIPEEVLQFSIYGNSTYGTQDMLVSVPINPVGASGDIVLNQNLYSIVQAYSPRIPGTTQYGNIQIFTPVPHGFEDGSLIFIKGSSPQINGAWNVIIPPGSTGYSFEIPVVLSNPLGDGTNFTTGQTTIFIVPSYYPNQTVTGGGKIDIKVNGRTIGATSAGESLQSTVNSIVEVVNLVYTQPDYIAGCFSPNSIPSTINILANTVSGNIGNGDILSVSVSGSLELVSLTPTLIGGGTSGSQYITWNENYGGFPDENLRYWGTKNLNWDSIPTSTWTEAYSHSWYDFEYDNEWIGGFEIHSAKVGDNIKVSTGNETFPFPIGVTFSATGGITGPSGYIKLGDAASELNSSTEPHISNFHYRVIPSSYSGTLTTSGPVETEFKFVGATSGGLAIPPTVPGAPPPLLVSFTYATGP
jgi:hypothetical protein